MKLIKKIIRKIKENILIRFSIYLKVITPIIFLLLYNLGFNISDIETMVIGGMCSLSISLTITMIHINHVVNKNNELIIKNYWKLKNELSYLKKRK